jgi:hypothetical protein
MGLPVPDGGQLDGWVADNGLVAGKVQSEDHRNRLACAGGNIDEQIRFRPILLCRKVDGDLFANCFSAKRILINIEKFEFDPLGSPRTVAEYIGLKEFENLFPPMFPVMGGLDTFAVVEYQRIWKREGADLRLVVISRLLLCTRPNANEQDSNRQPATRLLYRK